jgi:hypothetical protein
VIGPESNTRWGEETPGTVLVRRSSILAKAKLPAGPVLSKAIFLLQARFTAAPVGTGASMYRSTFLAPSHYAGRWAIPNEEQRNGLQEINLLGYAYACAPDSADREGQLLVVLEAFHGYQMKYLCMVVRGTIPPVATHAGKDAKEFLRTLAPRKSEPSKKLTHATCKMLHLALKGITTEDIYDTHRETTFFILANSQFILEVDAALAVPSRRIVLRAQAGIAVDTDVASSEPCLRAPKGLGRILLRRLRRQLLLDMRSGLVTMRRRQGNLVVAADAKPGAARLPSVVHPEVTTAMAVLDLRKCSRTSAGHLDARCQREQASWAMNVSSRSWSHEGRIETHLFRQT